MSTFPYRPFGLDPSTPHTVSLKALRLLRKYGSHLCPEPLSAGPADPVAKIHQNGRWRVRARWVSLLPTENDLDKYLGRFARAN
jgi:hypothetical protein